MQNDKPILSISGVTKRFGASVTAVDDVSLDIREGEFFALLGPSGCGKTTLLRMIAGFEVPSEGAILLEGADISATPPNRRPINMVFQSYAVFPHMSVFDNVAYGLKVAGTPRGEIRAKVEEALSLVKLDGFAARKPDQLSGGQRQRVALARALVKRPKILLLDEPLSALDAKLREAMQLELTRLQKSVGITFIIVTHDQGEALSMADRIAVMEAGRVRQVAEPEVLYSRPNCRFVADFIGKINLFMARVVRAEGDLLHLESDALGHVDLPCPEAMAHPAPGSQITLAVRPENFRLGGEAGADDLHIPGRITDHAYFGGHSSLFVEDKAGNSITVSVQNGPSMLSEADKCDSLHIFCSKKDVLILPE